MVVCKVTKTLPCILNGFKLSLLYQAIAAWTRKRYGEYWKSDDASDSMWEINRKYKLVWMQTYSLLCSRNLA